VAALEIERRRCAEERSA
jgi:GGDEF domain-containing protein